VSLLRYPGGKNRLLKCLWPAVSRLPTNVYAEPFVGGGSMALHVAKIFPETEIWLNDLDAEVAAFWEAVAGDGTVTDYLCELVEESRGPTDDPSARFDYWKAVRNSQPETDAERAFKLIFMNKTCYGGLLDGVPISGWDQSGWKGRDERRVVCQYSVDIILRNLRHAREMLWGRTHVSSVDAVDFMRYHRQMPMYLDPPYHDAKKMYRHMMTDAQHLRLAACLREHQADWVLSYNDDEFVRAAYADADVRAVEAHYSNRPQKENWTLASELFIVPKAPVVKM